MTEVPMHTYIIRIRIIRRIRTFISNNPYSYDKYIEIDRTISIMYT